MKIRTAVPAAPVPSSLLLFCASATALFVELALIRWTAAEIPTLGYFKNFPLLAAFIGLSLGCLNARARRVRFEEGAIALGALTLGLTFAAPLGWDHLIFPEPHVDMWELFLDAAPSLAVYVRNLAIIFALLAALATSFYGLGQIVAGALARGAPLRMYTVDILGSLTGTVSFSLLCWLHAPPLVWMGVALPMLWLVGLLQGVPWVRRTACLVPALLCVMFILIGQPRQDWLLVHWSPYYLIELKPVMDEKAPAEPPKYWMLRSNKYTLQVPGDYSARAGVRYPRMGEEWKWWLAERIRYEYPFLLHRDPRNVMVGAAGSGNDVAAALRHGAKRVVAVEIDPYVVELGRRFHPEHPYADPRVEVVTTDLRAFLRRSAEKFDLIVWSILDSHTALSSFSSLRLDNYVYTAESFRDAVQRLTPDGLMCVSFWESNRIWLGARMFKSITLGTGTEPVVSKVGQSVVFIFGPGLARDRVRERMARLTVEFAYAESVPGGAAPRTGTANANFEMQDASAEHRGIDVKPSVDDWPFMYTNPAGQPFVYYFSLLLMVVVTGGLVRWSVGRSSPAAPVALDWEMFLLGAGFLLVETKAITEIALLLGATWIVNSFVFAGIFLMVLAANVTVALKRVRVTRAAYAWLLATLVLWYVFPRASLNALAFWPRAVLGTGFAVLPLFFAGLCFARAFDGHLRPDLAFGSNLLGAVVGGASEALSLTWGIRFLTLLAMGFYALAWARASFGPASTAREGGDNP